MLQKYVNIDMKRAQNTQPSGQSMCLIKGRRGSFEMSTVCSAVSSSGPMQRLAQFVVYKDSAA